MPLAPLAASSFFSRLQEQARALQKELKQFGRRQAAWPQAGSVFSSREVLGVCSTRRLEDVDVHRRPVDR